MSTYDFSPQGYQYNIEPKGNHPFWETEEEEDMNITATALVDNNTGVPAVTVRKTQVGDNINFEFDFRNLKGANGDPGQDGVTPQFTVSSNTYDDGGSPSVDVNQYGTSENPELQFNFYNLGGGGGGGDQFSSTPINVNNLDDLKNFLHELPSWVENQDVGLHAILGSVVRLTSISASLQNDGINNLIQSLSDVTMPMITLGTNPVYSFVRPVLDTVLLNIQPGSENLTASMGHSIITDSIEDPPGTYTEITTESGWIKGIPVSGFIICDFEDRNNPGTPINGSSINFDSLDILWDKRTETQTGNVLEDEISLVFHNVICSTWTDNVSTPTYIIPTYAVNDFYVSLSSDAAYQAFSLSGYYDSIYEPPTGE